MSSSVTQSVTINDVYLGIWTNWSYGSIHGATLTLTRRDGGLLTAFLALFVTIAGTSFWRIACFALHHLLSSETARDGIYHQTQAILRNAANGTSGLWGLLRVNWVWRKHTQAQPYRRILPLITVTLTTLLAFALAGIFSSRVSTSMGNEVLLSNQNCGILVLDDVDEEGYWSTFLPYTAQRTVSSANYALGCYKNNTIIQDCPTFLRKSLPWTSEQDVGCPFPGHDKICCSNSTTLRLDTGYINSNFDLGINSPPEDRFLYRSVIECAPLKTKGYSDQRTLHSRTNDTSPRQIMRYFYGDAYARNESATYQYPADPPTGISTTNGINISASADYTVAANWAYTSLNGTTMDGTSSFIPVPDLQHPTADVTLVFLSANEIAFTKPIEDNWYSAHLYMGHRNHVNDRLITPSNVSFYYRDEPVRILGCTEQYQFCNPVLEPSVSCTPLNGIIAVQALAETLWQTEKGKALATWSARAILEDAIGLPEVIQQLGVSSLTSRYKLSDGVQGFLPDNQWQLDVEHWFTAILADLQRTVVETATGPIDTNTNQYLRRPQTPEERLLCHSQKIRNESFTSFSVLGLVVLLGVGGFIIGISFILESLVSWIQKRKNLNVYKRLEWTTNETLQLQRLAHEELNIGTWTRTEEDYPITAPGEQLAVLDISEPEHPRLQRFTVKNEVASDTGNYRTESTGEMTEQGVSTADLDHALSIPNPASTPLGSISPADDAQTLQPQNQESSTDRDTPFDMLGVAASVEPLIRRQTSHGEEVLDRHHQGSV